jgi:hypothetical protein
MIDLRSDTCSRPMPERRAAVVNAVIGHDVCGDFVRAPSELVWDEVVTRYSDQQNFEC